MRVFGGTWQSARHRPSPRRNRGGSRDDKSQRLGAASTAAAAGRLSRHQRAGAIGSTRRPSAGPSLASVARTMPWVINEHMTVQREAWSRTQTKVSVSIAGCLRSRGPRTLDVEVHLLT